MIFSGWVTHGPNAALSIATKWLSLRFLGEAAQPVEIALAVEHVGDRDRRAFAQVLLGRRHIEHAAIGAHAEAVAVLPPQGREHEAARHRSAGRPRPSARAAPSLVNGTPAAAAAPAKAVVFRNVLRSCVIVASLMIVAGRASAAVRARSVGLAAARWARAECARGAQRRAYADAWLRRLSRFLSAVPSAARPASRRASG